MNFNKDADDNDSSVRSKIETKEERNKQKHQSEPWQQITESISQETNRTPSFTMS